ncbi:unnamed protein product [Sphagnum balticum]
MMSLMLLLHSWVVLQMQQSRMLLVPAYWLAFTDDQGAQKEDRREVTHPRTKVEEEDDDDGRWAGRGKVSGIEAAGGSCKLLLLLGTSCFLTPTIADADPSTAAAAD